MKNFNSLFAILGGLNNTAIYRLSLSWKRVGKAESAAFKELMELTNSENNYQNYRSLLQETTPPYLPYLALISKDMWGVEEANKTFVNNTTLQDDNPQTDNIDDNNPTNSENNSTDNFYNENICQSGNNVDTNNNQANSVMSLFVDTNKSPKPTPTSSPHVPHNHKTVSNTNSPNVAHKTPSITITSNESSVSWSTNNSGDASNANDYTSGDSKDLAAKDMNDNNNTSITQETPEEFEEKENIRSRFSEEKYVNFSKLRIIWKIVSSFMLYRGFENRNKKEDIYKYIKHFEIKDDDSLYNLSLQLEPKLPK